MDNIPASRLLWIERPLQSGMGIWRVSGGAGLVQWMEFHSPFFQGLPEGLGQSGNGGGVGISKGFDIPKELAPDLNPAVYSGRKTLLGRWEWQQVQAGMGKIQENSTMSQNSWISFYSKKKISISTFSPFAPLFWDGRGSENPTEPPPKFSSEEKIPWLLLFPKCPSKSPWE